MKNRPYPLWMAIRLLFCGVVTLITCYRFEPSAFGQEVRAVAPDLRYEALPGEPFGVATLQIPLPSPVAADALRISIHEKDNRLFYPVFSGQAVELELKEVPRSNRRVGQGRLVQRLRESIKEMRDFRVDPRAVTIRFLFRGTEPLHVQVAGSIQQTIEIKLASLDAVTRRGRHEEAKTLWWEDFVNNGQTTLANGSLQPSATVYLCDMLQRRLELQPSLGEAMAAANNAAPSNRFLEDFDSRLIDALKLVGGMQDERVKMMQEMLSATRDTSAQFAPPPFSLDLSENELGSSDVPPPASTVEPLANFVPPEWLYIRFGSFANYLWFQSMADRHGGDIAQMITLRGVLFNSSARIEQLLNTKMTAIAKLFGDSVIEDMAIVGRDLYIQEGPSIGVLFRARNRLLLLSSFQSERNAEQKRLASVGAKLDKLKIRGREVSYLHTPDMRLRSFMVAEGSQVLVTSSRTMVERFLEIADGAAPMSATTSFRSARDLLPAENQYSVFAYFSPQFLRGLLSPLYQIELRRRVQAQAALDMVEMADWVAKNEGINASSVDELIQARLLPVDFMDRPDGAMVILENGQWRDTLRGFRGSMLPIADIELAKITRSEQQRYQSTLDYFQSEWQQLDPIVFGLRRFANKEVPNREQLILEAYVAPFQSEKYGWVSQVLGPPSPDSIVLPPDDIANIQLYLRGAPGTGTPNHQFFIGIKDMMPPDPAETKGLLKAFFALQSMPAYVGAWPAPGLLDILFPQTRNLRDATGFTRMFLGVWRWQGDGFSLLSFDRSIIENAAAIVRPEQVDDYAQVRFSVNDLAGSQLEPWLNRFWYRRGLAASLANAEHLNFIEQQFHLEPTAVRPAIEEMIGAKLQCPIGGELLWEGDERRGVWVSSVWPTENLNPVTATLAAGYRAPWIDWCRGGRVHLSQLPNSLAVLGIIDLEQLPEKEAAAPAGEVPAESSFFSLPMKMFSGGK